MRRKSAALLMFVGSVILSACTGRDSTSPRGVAPDQANYATSPGPSATCDFNAIKTAARNYFTSQQDSAFTYDQALQKAYNGGLDGNATNVGWQIGRLVARERLTSATTNGAAGSVYLIDVMRCMSDVRGTVPYASLTIPSDFMNNAALILDSGIWDIRTGGATGAPTLGKVKAGGTRAFGAPRWGVETQTSATTWPGSITYAVFGYPIKVGTPLLNSPTNINTNDDLLTTYVGAGTAPFNAFELGSVPDDLPRDGLRVGMCAYSDPTANDGQENLLVHNNSQILPTDSPNQMCSSGLIAAAAVAPTWYASIVHRAASVFTPQVAFAQISDCSTCIGGLPSDWSPFGPGTLTASGIVLSVVQQPANSFVDSTNTIVVKATFSGQAAPGVKIDSITVANNSGSPAGAVIGTSNITTTSFTAADGTFTITFTVRKAGGYLVSVWSSLDGGQILPATSNQFQVQNK